MNSSTTILWFRQDLRLQDNPALRIAAAEGRVLPLYILDDHNANDWSMGAASRWWLHNSLEKLNAQLDGKLWVFSGDPIQIIPQLMESQGINSIHWNRCYEPWRIKRDSKLKSLLEADERSAISHNGSLLWEPWTRLKKDGEPYKVFTPFYKNAVSVGTEIDTILGEPPAMELADCEQDCKKIPDLNLLPSINWYEGFNESFSPGEEDAWRKMEAFIEKGIHNYKKGRDYPALNSVSRISPHLHFGEIAPHRVWKQAEEAGGLAGCETEAEHFQRELAWREFSYSLLYHFPTLTEANLNERFDSFPWLEDQELLKAWQQGVTGYPLVDAGMRELWTTGYMHNRVRMIVGSFLVKNLMQHWQHGARWFWDCLLDADLPNNTCSWQWVAGCGADAAPYFRIFNPITQSQKFEAAPYIRMHVPELAGLSDKAIHEPAIVSKSELSQAGIELGKTYPHPIVDLKASRERALEAYQSIK